MKNGFVYKWINSTNNKAYIGYHIGDINDGYISSSHNDLFWEDFHNKKMEWIREIIFTGDSKSCLIEEQRILKTINLSNDKYYNNARGAEIIFTDDVRKKMSISGKKRWKEVDDEYRKSFGKKISKAKSGVSRDSKTIKKLKEYYNSDKFIGIISKEKYKETQEKIIKSNTGKKRIDKFKKEQSNRFLGEKNPMYGKKQCDKFIERQRIRFLSDDNPGKNKSDETCKKISKAKSGVPSKTKGIPRKKITCPFCGKIGGEGIMYRWHFNNCKNK